MELAKNYPDLKFIVQDLPPTIADAHTVSIFTIRAIEQPFDHVNDSTGEAKTRKRWNLIRSNSRVRHCADINTPHIFADPKLQNTTFSHRSQFGTPPYSFSALFAMTGRLPTSRRSFASSALLLSQPLSF
jgi:hypothetical protein